MTTGVAVNGKQAAIVAVGFGLVAASLQGADWPRWRGAAADGISSESGWNPAALSSTSAVAWQVQVGEGFSSMAIAGGRLYTMGNDNGQDTVWCLDAASGKEVWKHSYACDKGSHAGPRATPAVDGARVFTLSREGHLLCLDAGKGAVVWQKNVVADFKAENLGWGLSGSALVVGDKLLVNAGKTGLCLDKNTGAPVWTGTPGKGGYATPVFFELRGKPFLAMFGQKSVSGVALADGAVAWSHPWETSYDVNAADPIFSDGKLFISSGYDRGCALLDVSGAAPVVVWENRSMRSHIQNCVLWKGCLYGVDGNTGGGKLRCLDFATGQEKWSEDTGFGTLILVDGKLLVLNEKGLLTIGEAKPTGFVRLAEGKVLGRKVCWTAPAFSGGKVYCRNQPGDLVCVDLGK